MRTFAERAREKVMIGANVDIKKRTKKTLIDRLLYFNIFIDWEDYCYLILLERFEKLSFKQLWREYHNALPIFENALDRIKEEKDFHDLNDKLTLADLQYGIKNDVYKRRKQDLQWLNMFNS